MRRPATLKPKVKEVTLHMQVAAFLRAAWPADLIWLHPANGEHRDARTGHKLKQMGVRPGAPDLFFQLPNGQHGWIELKTEAGNLSPVQVEFRDRCLRHKAGYAVCRSLEEVERTLSNWLESFDPPRHLLARLAA